MSLIKLALDNDVESHHKLKTRMSTGLGTITGGIYGGMIGSIRSKKENTLIKDLQTAQKGRTIAVNQPQKWYQKLLRHKPNTKDVKIVDRLAVNDLTKNLNRLKKYKAAKTVGGALIGASLLGYGFNRLQNSENKYEKAYLERNNNA